MDKQLNCDFYFGDTLGNKIKTMDVTALKGYKRTVKNQKITKSGFLWQHGVWRLIFKPYSTYIITGSPAILSNWILLLLAKFSNKKVYAWSHGIKKPVKTRGDLFSKIFYRLCNKVLLYGEFSKTVMLQEGFKKSKLVPIYNSLDYNLQLDIRSSLKNETIYFDHFGNQNPVIIYVGRIQKIKKIDWLIKAVHELKKKDVPCNLVLVGADVENNGLTDLVHDYKLNENVWFYGSCYEETKIANLFYNASVCVSPGPVGLTALHALTFGCPVISNNDFVNQMPEHEAITPGITGDFFRNDNIESLIDCIRIWIARTEQQQQETKIEAYKTIDSKWNPNVQLSILKEVLK